VDEVVQVLRQGIESGRWSGWLPRERELSEGLQVSRSTLRMAISKLKDESIIESVRAKGNRILSDSGNGASLTAERTIGFLTPEAPVQISAHIVQWIDHLRGYLHEHGFGLVFHEGKKHYRYEPEKTLPKLVKQSRHACWVLFMTNERMQQWFADNRIPCVISGSNYPGISLPSVDTDFYALCHHAATTLMRAGHRKIAFITEQITSPGDEAGKDGFIDGVGSFKDDSVDLRVLRIQTHGEADLDMLRRLLPKRNPPTAVMVCKSFEFLSVISYLSHKGYRIPEDISVICRNDDGFMPFLVPSPARYETSAELRARRIMKLVNQVVSGGAVSKSSVRIMPNFIPGNTVAPPRE